MQEKRSPVFVFATANNTKHLPPEFLRKGRFDEVFFLDLPTAEERQAILEVHLRRKNFSMVRQKFDLVRIADETRGFVGAELEAVVKAAMFPAFRDGQRELDDDDLLQAARDMVPLAKSHAKIVEELRALVKSGQARNASRAAAQEVELGRIRGERLLDI
jgi:SpoVK/Ycf46/Vps4 family AAA+-type ATPase